MADIKTVTLTGGEVRVEIERRHCHIRNLGSEMIYASIKPGIVPEADGVLGIPAGTKDVLTDTDGYIYLKGTGKAQLVGSEYANGILGGLAGTDIDAAVAASVAKIVAGAPADFDTLKEISDWITSHSESAAAMNSDIQSLKTNKADKTSIPTTLPASGGNADTVDGCHAYQIDTLDISGQSHNETGRNHEQDAFIQWDGTRYRVRIKDGMPVGVNHADNADSVGGRTAQHLFGVHNGMSLTEEQALALCNGWDGANWWMHDAPGVQGMLDPNNLGEVIIHFGAGLEIMFNPNNHGSSIAVRASWNGAPFENMRSYWHKIDCTLMM